MRYRIGVAAGFLLLAAGGLRTGGLAQETQAAIQQATKARATLVDAQGTEVGTATLTQQPNGVLVDVQVSGLPPGAHGFHIHETGACKPPRFASAGGHFNPTGRQHGMEVPDGPHAGDLPNIRVGPNGSGRLTTLNPYVTLGRGKTSLLKEGGTALILHSGSDDYHSQPSGGAGREIACGTIEGA